MKLSVKVNNRIEVYEYEPGDTLLNIMRSFGISFGAPCGGNGICGRCKAIVNGETVLACSCKPQGDIDVRIPDEINVVMNTEKIECSDDGLGLAVDIGTTTVAAYLYDLRSGICIASAGEENRQRSYGDNVISRISYASEPAGLKSLREIIVNQIMDIAGRLTDECKNITEVSIAGNTVMEHIFAGISPESIGITPFTPADFFGKTVSVPEFKGFFNEDCEVYLSGCISGYVGGDITAGMLTDKIYDSEHTVLLLDVGTNGEMVLGSRDKWTACAVAAGPAFDSSDMRGSNVIDAIAEMLRDGTMDETGYIVSDAPVSQKTVRDVQLAKAAVRAGIETLLKLSQKTCDDIDTLYLAGGFGTFINVENACAIGMIPNELKDKTVRIGNAAGRGASLLLNKRNRTVADEFIKKISYEELSSSQLFSDLYLENITFE